MLQFSQLLALLSVIASITLTAAAGTCKQAHHCAAQSHEIAAITSYCTSYLSTRTITTTTTSLTTSTTGPTTITTTIVPPPCAAPGSAGKMIRAADAASPPSCLAATGSKALSSACKCFVTAAKTTVTSTLTGSTTVALSTSTATVTGPFALYFAPQDAYGVVGEVFMNATAESADSASGLYLDSANKLVYQGRPASSDGYPDDSYVEFDAPGSAYQYDLNCTFKTSADGTCPMTCYQQAHGTTQNLYDGLWVIGANDGSDASLKNATIFAVSQ